LHSLNDGGPKQHSLFSNSPECDAPFQSAGVEGSTVMVTAPFEELFGFVRAEASFPVHEVVLVNKILATL
jgi:hypothetical protein